MLDTIENQLACVCVPVSSSPFAGFLNREKDLGSSYLRGDRDRLPINWYDAGIRWRCTMRLWDPESHVHIVRRDKKRKTRRTGEPIRPGSLLLPELQFRGAPRTEPICRKLPTLSKLDRNFLPNLSASMVSRVSQALSEHALETKRLKLRWQGRTPLFVDESFLRRSIEIVFFNKLAINRTNVN